MNGAFRRWIGLAAACFAPAILLWGCNGPQKAERSQSVTPSRRPAISSSTTTAQKPASEATGPTVATVGQKCPPFSYELIDGQKVDLSTYKGKHLILYVTSYT
jgi:hypothetical protein